MKTTPKFTRTGIDGAKKVMDAISTDLRSHHPFRELAKKAGTNHFTLKQIFRDVFGTSIYQFRIRQRIEYAKKELATTDKLIADIADELGYGNAEYFSLCFKKLVGISPSDFRKQNNPAYK